MKLRPPLHLARYLYFAAQSNVLAHLEHLRGGGARLAAAAAAGGGGEPAPPVEVRRELGDLWSIAPATSRERAARSPAVPESVASGATSPSPPRRRPAR